MLFAATNRPESVLRKQKAPTAVNVARRSCSWGFFPKWGMMTFLIDTAIERLAVSLYNTLSNMSREISKMIAKCDLFPFWIEKEKELGHKLIISKIACEIGIHRHTLSAYLSPEGVQQPDMESVAKICQYFDISPGPVPFIRFE